MCVYVLVCTWVVCLFFFCEREALSNCTYKTFENGVAALISIDILPYNTHNTHFIHFIRYIKFFGYFMWIDYGVCGIRFCSGKHFNGHLWAVNMVEWMFNCYFNITRRVFFARGVRMNYVKKGCSRWSNDISFSSFVNYVIAKMLMDFDWKKDISVYWKEFHFVSSEGSWCFSELTNLNHSFLFAHNPKCTIHVWFL